jgi:hypothetical protein
MVKFLHTNPCQFPLDVINDKNLQIENIFDVLGYRRNRFSSSPLLIVTFANCKVLAKVIALIFENLTISSREMS